MIDVGHWKPKSKRHNEDIYLSGKGELTAARIQKALTSNMKYCFWNQAAITITLYEKPGRCRGSLSTSQPQQPLPQRYRNTFWNNISMLIKECSTHSMRSRTQQGIREKLKEEGREKSTRFWKKNIKECKLNAFWITTDMKYTIIWTTFNA